MNESVRQMFITPDNTLRQCIETLNRSGEGIVLVVDKEQRLEGTITDGDIRRAILAGISLDVTVPELLERHWSDAPRSAPIPAPYGTNENRLLKIMSERSLLHIPLVDKNGTVVDVALLRHLAKEQQSPVNAVVMAGGYGTRLRPLTEDMPKPMLPVGDRPLMEIIIQQLQETGIKDVKVTLHHQAEKITEYFGDGRRFGVDITYLNEENLLVTAGALAMLEPPDATTLVINGDVLTQVNLREMLAYHNEYQADVTMAVHKHEVQVPFGVVESNGPFVRSLTEKPQFDYFINAGIYMLEPPMIALVPKGDRFDMTDLIQMALAQERPVAAFPVHEYWIDIGQHADYQQAQHDLEAREIPS